MRDMRDLIAKFEFIRGSGEVAALATVMRVVGSAYRRAGARMLLAADGTRVGLISGGCLEADLMERAQPVLATGLPITVTYDASSDEDLIFGLGLGCNGTVEVLIERVPERPAGGHLALIGRCMGERRRLALATVFRSTGHVPLAARCWLLDGEPLAGDLASGSVGVEIGPHADAVLRSGRHRNVTIESPQGSLDLLIEPVCPLPEFWILGAGPDAQPVARLAAELGFNVNVADHRAAIARREYFPGASRVVVCNPDRLAETVNPDDGSIVLVMSHSYANDRAYLRSLLTRSFIYLGLLGPRQRSERILAELAKEGIEPSREQRTRLHAPVGLDIGAETPEEIALSILSEVWAELTGRSGGRLRDRKAPIHGG
ncbi:MAG: XdhC family protein [Gammaproteobacteria bacterium]|nr:XdhC family protein [Gammaproteobacteria bacterium]